VEGDEEASAIVVDAQELRPDDWYVADGEGSKVEHGRRCAMFGIDQVEFVVRHARSEGAVAAIMWDKLDIDRAGWLHRVADGDRARDRAVRQIPHTDAAAQEDAISTGDVQRMERTDEVTRHHQVMGFVDRNAMRIESITRETERPRLHEVLLRIILDDPPWLG